MRKLLLFLCLFISMSLGGCGGGSSSEPAPLSAQSSSGGETASAPILQTQFYYSGTSAQGTLYGISVDVAAAALSEDTTVVLVANPSPPQQPVSPLYRAVGPYLTINTGSAQIQGPVTFTFPNAPAGAQVWMLVDGNFGPLLNPTQNADGSVSGTLNFAPDAQPEPFSVGLVVPPTGDPAHVNWGSWNGYVFNPSTSGGTGTFTKVISLGQPTGTLPTLGAHPLMFVHGLGSSIISGTFNAEAQYIWNQGQATCIVGFEYDTLDSVQTNGNFLRAALFMFRNDAQNAPVWNIVAHSMGTLVTRSAIEQPGPALSVAPSGNRAVLMCGPHLGSALVNYLQERNALGILINILNQKGYMQFNNSDGERCAVLGTEQGITDLRTDSVFLATINVNAARNHPQFAYFTMAGTVRRSLLEFASLFFPESVRMTDGLVNLNSASYPGLGQLVNSALEFDHLTVNIPSNQEGDGDTSFPEISRLLAY